MLAKVNLADGLASIRDHWRPKIAGEVNDIQIKLAKLRGEFIWHHHDKEDEMFLVVKGCLRMKLRDGDVTISEGEFLIVPRGVEHLPVADEETHILLFEPKTTVNTGNLRNERTLSHTEHL